MSRRYDPHALHGARLERDRLEREASQKRRAVWVALLDITGPLAYQDAEWCLDRILQLVDQALPSAYPSDIAGRVAAEHWARTTPPPEDQTK